MENFTSIQLATGVNIKFSFAQTLFAVAMLGSVLVVIGGTLWSLFGKSIESRRRLARTGEFIHKILFFFYGPVVIVCLISADWILFASSAFFMACHWVAAKVAASGNGSLFSKLKYRKVL